MDRPQRYRVLSEAARAKLIAAASKDGLNYQAMFAFMVEQGPRPGEVQRLRWSDLDIKAATARIWATKTYRERFLALTPTVVRLLSRLRKQRMKAGTIGELVFVNARGKRVDQSRLNRRLRRRLERAGLPTEHSIYDLRHTFATLAHEAGRSDAWIAGQMGDSIETVRRFYTHPLSPQRDEKRATSVRHE